MSWSHAGALEDTCGSWLVRTPDGLALAFLTNTLPPLGDIGRFFPELGGALLAAARQEVGLPAPLAPAPAQVPPA